MKEPMILVIRSRASKQQAEEMLQALVGYIKLAVDIKRGVLAGGGILHADCESLLLDDGSKQEDIWGKVREAVAKITRKLLGAA